MGSRRRQGGVKEGAREGKGQRDEGKDRGKGEEAQLLGTRVVLMD